jgi:hypothetical protein
VSVILAGIPACPHLEKFDGEGTFLMIEFATHIKGPKRHGTLQAAILQILGSGGGQISGVSTVNAYSQGNGSCTAASFARSVSRVLHCRLTQPRRRRCPYSSGVHSLASSPPSMRQRQRSRSKSENAPTDTCVILPETSYVCVTDCFRLIARMDGWSQVLFSAHKICRFL